MKKTLSPDEALYRAAALCSTGEHCRSDIEEKLSRWGIPAEDSRRIIAHLEAEKYIDEERYCRSFVHDKVQFDHWGRVKIATALRQKKISGNIITNALSLIDENAYRTMLQDLVDRKRQQLGEAESPAARAKVVRFALSRGFEPNLVFAICGGSDHETFYDE